MTEPKYYPSWRFHPTQPGVIVQTAEEDAALKAQHKGWRDTPYSPEEVAKITGRGVPGLDVPDQPGENVDEVVVPSGRPEDWKPPVDETEEAAEEVTEDEVEHEEESTEDEPPVDDELSDADKAELYGTKAKELVAMINTVADLEWLKRVKAAEKKNPNGPRKMVLSAVRKRIRTLKSES